MTRKSAAKTAEKANTEIQRRKRHLTFKTPLQDAERGEAMVRLSQAAIDLAKAQHEFNEKKDAVRRLRSEMDAITQEIMAGRSEHLECWEIKDFAANRVRFERVDTGALLEEREMHEWERRQPDLAWDDENEDEDDESADESEDDD